MLLYHYTDKDLNEVKIDFFGDNAYTFNDKKYNVKRSFFYLEPKPQEYRFKDSQYCYIVEINEKSLYNLIEDKDNLKIKFKNDVLGLLLYCKAHYKGITYNVGFNIVSLFINVPIKERSIKQ
jgi:hypothetical protein